jgi:hypothetical protein
MHLQEEGKELTGDHLADNDIAREHYRNRITGDGSKLDRRAQRTYRIRSARARLPV